MNDGDKHNNHVLPKLYLKGFVIKKGEPFIWVYKRGQPYNPSTERYNHRNKIKNNPYKDTIKNAGVVKDFYADRKVDGTRDYETFENKLELLEKPHDPIFKKLLARQMITAAEKRRFSSYIVLMYRRVQTGRKIIKELVSKKGLYEPTDELFQKLNWPNTPETRTYIKQYVEHKAQEKEYHVQQHNRITAASPDSLIVEKLQKMTWTFYIASGSDFFVTGDNPVFIPDACGLAGDKKKSELSFPISTDVALVASWNRTLNEGFVEATPQIIKDINRRTVSKASKYIFFSKNAEWVVNLLNKNPYEYHPISK
jgi:hypothetical protein